MTDVCKVFHAVAAVVTEVQSATELSVCTTTDGSIDSADPNRQFDVKSQQTLGPASNWDNAIFDDYGTIVPGQISEPLDPSQPIIGWVYVEHDYYTQYSQTFVQSWLPGWSLAKHTSIAYLNSSDNGSPPTVTHYHGYWAHVTPSSPFTVAFSDPNSNVITSVTFDNIHFLKTPPPEAYEQGTHLMIGNETTGTLGVVFVEQSYAASLGLICPKVPIGLGSSGPSGSLPPPSGDPPPNVRANPGQGHKIAQRINISLVDPDPILEMVLDQIDDEARVAGAFPTTDDKAGVFGIVSSRNKPGLPVAIDLIAHAYEGVLEFGTWQINSTDQISIMLEGEWKNRSPSEIRLLGCYTARTTAGQAAMRHLKNVFSEKNNDVRVYGAKTLLFANDFGPQGFHADDELVEVDALPEAIDPPFPSDVVDRWFARFPPVSAAVTIKTLLNSLRTETFDEAKAARVKPWAENRGVVTQSRTGARIDDLFSELSGTIFKVPGLLEHPDSEQLYPAGVVNGTAVFHRVTTFRGAAFVRVYTTDFPEGVLVR